MAGNGFPEALDESHHNFEVLPSIRELSGGLCQQFLGCASTRDGEPDDVARDGSGGCRV